VVLFGTQHSTFGPYVLLRESVSRAARCRRDGVAAMTEMNRIQVVLFGTKYRTLGPYFLPRGAGVTLLQLAFAPLRRSSPITAFNASLKKDFGYDLDAWRDSVAGAAAYREGFEILGEDGWDLLKDVSRGLYASLPCFVRHVGDGSTDRQTDTDASTHD
jgi:hypothetical protein